MNVHLVRTNSNTCVNEEAVHVNLRLSLKGVLMLARRSCGRGTGACAGVRCADADNKDMLRDKQHLRAVPLVLGHPIILARPVWVGVAAIASKGKRDKGNGDKKDQEGKPNERGAMKP